MRTDRSASNPRAPRKDLGQHFLTHQRDCERIRNALEAGADDTVLEIGPGTGALTRLLAPRCGRLLLLEKDPRFVEDLRERYRDQPHVSVIAGDATAPGIGDLVPERVRVVGNLPYNVGTAILMNLLSLGDRIVRIVVMLQQEVAERVAAPPGHRARGALSLQVQARMRPSILFRIPPGHFFPPPAVWSAVVLLTPEETLREFREAARTSSFDRLAQALFAQPRKTVRNSLEVGTRLPREDLLQALAAASIDPGSRPSEITLPSFMVLWRLLGPRLGGQDPQRSSS